MKTKTYILALSLACLIPALAQAKPEGGQGKGQRPAGGELFKKLDADQSGTISKEEAKGPLAENFDEIDADGDGEITKDEMKAAAKERGGDRGGKMKEADTDESGSISKAEAEAAGLDRLVEHFDELDADGDGEVTKEEMKAAAEKRGGERKGKGKGKGQE